MLIMRNKIKKFKSAFGIAVLLLGILPSVNATKSDVLSLNKSCSTSDSTIDSEIEKLEKDLLSLKIQKAVKEGKKSLEEILKAFKECYDFYSDNKNLRGHHFGYPANMAQRSTLVEILGELENKGYLCNNCGDVDETGNYKMDSKKVEKEILNIFAKKFGIQDNYWGYITSGGSESNAWAINASFKKNPNGTLYFCESAHYSIYKNSDKLSKRVVIPQTSDIDESIDVNKLCEEIEKNYNTEKSPANIILTWGTTKFGSCDDVKTITDFLKSKNIPYYIHLDAALYGGIPNNQIDAPVVKDIRKLGIDSISVSLHKYIGVPVVKSVLLSTSKGNGEYIDYIGQEDTTTCGSRDIRPFSMKYQVLDMLEDSQPEDYSKNIKYFESKLLENNISYVKADKGNIFVIDAPSDEICSYFQLSCFSDKNGKSKAHIIIFPYHSQSSMDELIKSLRTHKS